MDGPRNQFLAGTAFARDQHRRARILQPGYHAQHILNIRGSSDDAVEIVFRVHSLAQKFVFGNEPDLLRHSL